MERVLNLFPKTTKLKIHNIEFPFSAEVFLKNKDFATAIITDERSYQELIDRLRNAGLKMEVKEFEGDLMHVTTTIFRNSMTIKIRAIWENKKGVWVFNNAIVVLR